MTSRLDNAKQAVFLILCVHNSEELTCHAYHRIRQGRHAIIGTVVIVFIYLFVYLFIYFD